MTGFPTERELVAAAQIHLPFREWLSASSNAKLFEETELDGLFGIPDLVVAVLDGIAETSPFKSIAFEMKLSDWRRGLAQAFRYRAFASASVLVMDADRIGAARANLERFHRANIGLVGLGHDGEFEILCWPKPDEPFSAGLAQILEAMVSEELIAPRGWQSKCRPRGSEDAMVYAHRRARSGTRLGGQAPDRCRHTGECGRP